jgi:acyl transferase domain-containing protein/acyl carrier protein
MELGSGPVSDLSQRIANLSPEQKRLLEIQLGKKRGVPEPIAIVGVGCRFPGANSALDYWQLLQDGKDAIRDIPADRWDLDEFFDSDPEQPGKHYCRQGGFLDQIDQFEPEFFGIAPREAAYIDPQQRLLLEVLWEALEDAALLPEQLSGTKTGVFVGASTLDYGQLLLQRPDQIAPYTTTGLASTMLANRVSYLLNFQGPSLTVDTACSSSLVAVHLACQSLWQGEATVALAGGVNVMLTPALTIGFSKLTALSPDGRCKAFDAEANGFVRSEGAGVIVLKPLSQALADGDRIYALIRGGAVNQDGRTNGLTAPNREAQEQVLRDAYRQARVPLEQVSYIEAHGTGTLLGDPIEAKALGHVFSPNHSLEQPIRLGSVKSNIGHTEAAAGIASLIKVALELKHQRLVPSIHFHQPNPYIPFDQLPLQVQTEVQPWADFSEHTIAGVSSFGFGGTNSHIVLQAPPQLPVEAPEVERPCHMLTLSARSEVALRSLAKQYLPVLQETPESELGNLCFTTNTGRTPFNYRLAATASTREDLHQALLAFVLGQSADSLQTALPVAADETAVVWLFTGQGSQYPGMGQQLYQTQPVFRAALDRCDEILQPYLQESLLQVLYPASPDDQRLHQTAYTQPALFALEYALAQLWQAWGIQPAAVLGHSVGEYVAACVAGVFSLEDGLKLIAQRGRLMQSLPENGMMAAVLADPETVARVIAPYGETVVIATLNGPRNTVIAGLREDVKTVLAEFENRQISVTPLTVSHAFHSPLMEPMLNLFEHMAHQIRFQPPRIPMVTNLSGGFLVPGEVPDASYWRRHAREAVRFAEGIATLSARGYTHFLEIGPHPVLSRLGQQCLPDATCRWLPSLRRQRPDWDILSQSLSRLYLDGIAIDWQGFDRPYSRQKLSLPTYPFQRRSYWIDWATTVNAGTPSLVGAMPRNGHPLLGDRLYSVVADDNIALFEVQIQDKVPAYLKDHQVFDHTVLPAAAFLEMALAAGATQFPADQIALEEFALEQGLILEPQTPVVVQTLVKSQDETTARVEIFSRTVDTTADDGEILWTRHATGQLVKAGADTESPSPLPHPPKESNSLVVEDYYRQLNATGLQYGPAFQPIQQLTYTQSAAWGDIKLPPAAINRGTDYWLHPVLLDGCFQTVGALLSEQAVEDTYLPLGVTRLRLFSKNPDRLTCWVKRLAPHGQTADLLTADLVLYGEQGQRVAEVDGLLLRRTNRDRLLQHLQPDISQYCYSLTWQPQPMPPNSQQQTLSGNWLVLAEEDTVFHPVREALAAHGGQGIQVGTGAGYAQLTDDHFRVNPTQEKDFRQLFKTLANRPLRGILHLWSLAPQANSLETAAHLEEGQKLGCASTLHLIQGLLASRPSPMPRLWLVTHQTQAVIDGEVPQAAQASLWGLGRVIALEHPELHCVRVDLPSVQDFTGLLETLTHPEDGEDQIAYRQNQRYIPRLQRFALPETEAMGATDLFSKATAVQLQATGTGILDDLALVPLQRQTPGPGEVEIRVRATGLNFRDVLNALGMLKQYMADLGLAGTEVPFGGECSGEVVAVGAGVTNLAVGDEVIAALAIGSLGSYTTVPANLVVPKPDNLSFEEAATVSTAFLTAYYGLCQLAKLQPGERVLIHAAAGGVGQAAVQIAQWRGAEVYGTASPPKWDALNAMGVNGVMNSRTLDFAEDLMQLTQGKGVDVVLNSLTGDFIGKSLSVVAPQGRFVEIGKIGIWDPAQMATERPDVSYFPFDLLDVAQATPDLVTTMLQEIMEQFRLGNFRPLPHQTFPLEQSVEAFRHMAQAKHIGKVVISQTTTDAGTTANGMSANSPGESAPTIRSDRPYLITGGLGALGLEVARWLVEQGACQVVLVSRRGEPSPTAAEQLARLTDQGAEIRVMAADISNPNQVEHLFQQLQQELPPLAGIFHTAGLLQDGLLLQQSWEQFEKVMAPKVAGSWNLHRYSQELPLDYFVCFSSIASVLGSPSQANYSAANGFMDGLMQHRRAMGLPGLSINWGPWGEVGMAARLDRQNRSRMADQGITPLSPSHGLLALEALLATDAGQVAVLAVDWPKFLKQLPVGISLPLLENFDRRSDTPEPRPSGLLQQLGELPEEDRQRALMDYLRSEIAKVLGLSNSGEIEPRDRLFDLGLDSLMAVDLKNRLEDAIGQNIPTTLLFDYPTVEALTNYLLQEALVLPTVTPEAKDDDRLQTEGVTQLLADLAQMSERATLQQLIKQRSKT